MLFTFVSQWHTRLGRMPSRPMRSALHISSARSSMMASISCTRGSLARPMGSAASTSRSCFRRNSILWKSLMVSPSCTGRSASIDWNCPKASPAARLLSAFTACLVMALGMKTIIRQYFPLTTAYSFSLPLTGRKRSTRRSRSGVPCASSLWRMWVVTACMLRMTMSTSGNTFSFTRCST